MTYDREDQEYRKFHAILGMVERQGSVAGVILAATKFVRTQPNPVYSEHLIRVLAQGAFEEIRRLDFDNEPAYARSVVTNLTTRMRALYEAGTMEDTE